MLTNAERAELVRDIAAEVVRQLLPYVEYGEYLTSKQVCDILNWSMATLKKHSGEIPHKKVGDRNRYDRKAVMALIK